MEDQVYIVVNKTQEMAVLEKLQKDGKRWFLRGKATKWLPSKEAIPTRRYPHRGQLSFPYAIFVSDDSRYLDWMFLSDLDDEIILYDGRKIKQDMDRIYYEKLTRQLEDRYII